MDFNPHTREGCDGILHSQKPPLFQFQSTHPRRVRLAFAYSRTYQLRISIHTPAKGATDTFLKIAGWSLLFQSTHPRRVRPASQSRSHSSSIFQSTHPRRVRHLGRYACSRVLQFQSTHPRRVRREWNGNPAFRE